MTIGSESYSFSWVSFSEIWWWTFWIGIDAAGEATVVKIGEGLEVWVESVSDVGIAIDVCHKRLWYHIET
jgi:hypothetical protein